jgi:hypothetical protein
MLAVVFGISLGAIGIDLGGRVGVFVAVLLPAVIPRWPSAHRPSRQRPPRESSLMQRGVLGAGVIAVGVADVIFGPRLAHQYGVVAVVLPAGALWSLTYIRRMIGRALRLRATRRRIAIAINDLVLFALGVMLVCGIPSRHDEQFGAIGLARLIGSLSFVWVRVKRRLTPLIRPVERLFTRVEHGIGFVDAHGDDDRALTSEAPLGTALHGRPARTRDRDRRATATRLAPRRQPHEAPTTTKFVSAHRSPGERPRPGRYRYSIRTRRQRAPARAAEAIRKRS